MEGYTLKEMIQEIRLAQQAHELKSNMQLATLESIDAHLKNLNSKVATNVINIAKNTNDIDGLKTFQTRALVVWGGVVFILAALAPKVLAAMNI